LIDQFPNLEIIANVGVGYDVIAVKHAASKRIHVTNTPNVLDEDVADLAIAMMVWLTRKIWILPQSKIAPSLRGKSIGILGLGRIGSEIGRRAEAMGMDVLYTNRNRRPESTYRFVPDLAQLARLSDVLVLSLSAGFESRKMVNDSVLEALGPEGILVNISRGSIVDQDALISALRRGTLGGAALDVFEDEPNVPDSLLTMNNVMLTPHIGSATVETRSAMAELAIANLDAHFSGRPLLTEVPETKHLPL
jgi:lactate dehydrogenase-like 2-hydroxyacid dehydrogenase